MARDDDPLIGATLHSYKIEARIGQGGMARVYRASHTYLPREYAVKVLHGQYSEDPEFRVRFEREALATSKITHPNVVTLEDFGVTEDGLPFLVMEWASGRTLHEQIHAEAPFPPARAANVARQLAEGLAAAHALGFVHRDLKPGNVIMVPAGDGVPEVAKILDFGLVRVIGDQQFTRLTRAGDILGTPFYMAPELFTEGTATPASDLYALGVVLYEMIAGKLPFRATRLPSLMMEHVHNPPPPLPEAAGLDGLAMHLLAKAAPARPARAEQVIAAIDELDLPAWVPPAITAPLPVAAVSRRPSASELRRKEIAIAAERATVPGIPIPEVPPEPSEPEPDPTGPTAVPTFDEGERTVPTEVPTVTAPGPSTLSRVHPRLATEGEATPPTPPRKASPPPAPPPPAPSPPAAPSATPAPATPSAPSPAYTPVRGVGASWAFAVLLIALALGGVVAVYVAGTSRETVVVAEPSPAPIAVIERSPAPSPPPEAPPSSVQEDLRAPRPRPRPPVERPVERPAPRGPTFEEVLARLEVGLGRRGLTRAELPMLTGVDAERAAWEAAERAKDAGAADAAASALLGKLASAKVDAKKLRARLEAINGKLAGAAAVLPRPKLSALENRYLDLSQRISAARTPDLDHLRELKALEHDLMQR